MFQSFSAMPLNNLIQKNTPTVAASRLMMAIVCLLFVAKTQSLYAQEAGNKTETARAIKKNYRKVYVPLKDIDVLLKKVPQGVLMTQEEFEKLFKNAMEAAEKANIKIDNQQQTSITSGLFINQATYECAVDGKQLKTTARFQFSKPQKGWSLLPIPTQGLQLESSKVDGKSVAVSQRSPKESVFVTNQIGKFELVLTFTSPLRSVGSDLIAQFHLLATPAMNLKIKTVDKKFLVVNGNRLSTTKEKKKPPFYTIPVGGKKTVTIRISDQQTGSQSETLVFSQTRYGLFARPGEVTWNAENQIQVHGQKIDKVHFSIPNHLEIVDVQSTGLESWKSTVDPNNKKRTQIALQFRQKFDGQQAISLKGVMSTEEEEEWEVPILQVKNAASNLSHALIRMPQGIRLQTIEAEGVRPGYAGIVNPKLLKQGVSSEQLVFEIWKPDASILFLTREKERQVQAAMTTLVQLEETAPKLLVLADIETYFVPLFNFHFELPAGWVVTSLQRDGKPIAWQTSSEQAGINIIRVTLKNPLQSGQKMQLSMKAHQELEEWPVEEKPLSLALPSVKVPDVHVLEGSYGVIVLHEGLNIVPEEITGLTPKELGLVGERLGFSYQDSDFTGSIKIERVAAQIAAQTTLVSRIDRKTFSTHLESLLSIEGGGVRELELTLDKNVGTGIRFQLRNCAAQIIEQIPGKVVDGRQPWSLRLDRRLTGTALLRVDITTERDAKEEFLPPKLLITNAERQDGYLALEAGSDQQLTITATNTQGQMLANVDPADFPAMQYHPKERLVASYRFLHPDYSLKIKETRFDRMAIPPAIIEEAVIKTILDENNASQHQAILQFKAVGIQSLRLNFKEDAKLWSLLLDGKPIEIRKGDRGYIVPVQIKSQSAKTHRLEIFYQTGLSQKDANLENIALLTPEKNFRAQAPLLSIVSGAGQDQPLTVLKQEWVLIYPNQLAIVESQGAFTPKSPLDTVGWLHNWKSWLDYGSIDLVGIKLVGLLILVALIIGFLAGNWRTRAAGVLLIGLLIFTSTIAMLTQPIGCGSSNEGAFMAETKSKYDSTASAPMNEFKTEAASPPGKKSKHLDVDMGEEMSKPQAKPSSMRPQSKSVPKQADKIQKDEPIKRQQPAPASPSEGKPTRDTNNKDTDRQTGALLSIAIDLEQPEGTSRRVFQYLGTQAGADGSVLKVSYQNYNSMRQVRWFVAIIMLVVCWFLKRASVRIQAAIVIFGLMLPLGLVPIVPAFFAILLEGLFLGTLLGLLLWAIVYCHRCTMWCGEVLGYDVGSAPASTATMLILLVSLFLGTLTPNTAFAEKVIASKKITSQKMAAKKTSTPVAPENSVAPENNNPFVKDQTIYVPYQAGTDPLASKRIFLPQKEFLKLYQLAHPKNNSLPNSPLASVLGETLLSAKLVLNKKTPKKSRVEFQTRTVVTSYRNTPITIPLPFHHVSLQEAKLDGKSASILTSAHDQTLRLIVSKPGLHVVDLKFSIAAQIAGNSGQFTLPLHKGGYGVLSLTLPPQKDNKKKLKIRVNNTANTYRLRTEGDNTILETALPKRGLEGGSLSVSWEPQKVNGSNSSFILSETLTRSYFSDKGVSTHAVASITARHGAVSDVQFQLPLDAKLQSISGSFVGGWQVETTPKSKLLTLFFRNPIDGSQPNASTQVEINLFMPLAIDEGETELFKVPQVVPLNVMRDVGKVGIYSNRLFKIQVAKQNGLRQINGNQLTFSDKRIPTREKVIGAASNSPSLAFEYNKRPVSLELNVTRKAPEAKATVYHGLSIGLRKKTVATLMKYELSGFPQTRFAVYIPEGYLPLKVESPGMSDWYVSDDGQIVLEYSPPVAGTIYVKLNGTTPIDPEFPDTSLDVPIPLNVKKLDSYIGTWFEGAQSGRILETPTWKTVAPSAMPAQILKLNNKLPRFGFHSSSTEPEFVSIDLSRKASLLQGDSVTLIAVSESSIDYGFSLRWKISQSAENRFSVITPDWLKGRLNFDRKGVRQVIEKELSDGRIQWIIHLHSPVTKEFFTSASATVALPENNQITAPALEFQSMPVKGAGKSLETQRHYAVLVNLSQAQLSSQNLKSVAPNELRIKLSQSLLNQAAEIVRVQPNQKPPVWKRQWFDRQQSSAATVRIADLVTVLEHDGSWRTHAKYTMRNRSRQFLSLQLPEGAKLLSVYVNKKASRAVVTKIKGTPSHLIALPQTSAADLSFPVSVIIEGKSSKTLAGKISPIAREWEIPVPKVVSMKQSAIYGIPVAQTKWAVHVPDTIIASAMTSNKKTNVSQDIQDNREEAYQTELFKELSSLNTIIENNSGSPFTRVQQQRAAENYRSLKGKISFRYRAYSESSRSDSLKRKSLNQEQEDLLSKLEDNANGLKNISPPNANRSSTTLQRNGKVDAKGYINRSNAAIRRNNPTKREKETTQKEQRFQFHIDRNRAQEKIQVQEEARLFETTRDALGGKNRPAKKPVKPKADLRNRRSLLQKKFSKQNRQLNTQIVDEIKEPKGQSYYPPLDGIKDKEGRGFPSNLNNPAPNSSGFGGGSSFGGFGGGSSGSLGNGKQNMDENIMLGTFPSFENSSTGKENQQVTIASLGGLSIPIEIPNHGHVLFFSKVGGDPQLTLQVQSEQSVQSLFSWGWTLGWLIGIGFLLLVCIKSNTRPQRTKQLTFAFVLIIVGTLVFFFTRNETCLWGLAAIILGLLAWWFAPKKVIPNKAITSEPLAVES